MTDAKMEIHLDNSSGAAMEASLVGEEDRDRDLEPRPTRELRLRLRLGLSNDVGRPWLFRASALPQSVMHNLATVRGSYSS